MIPKKIISTGSVNQINNPSIQKSWDHMQKLLDDWSIKIYTDKECRKFIQENFENNIFEAYEKINPSYGAAKADLFRYCAIYQLGGIYIDIKSSIEEKPSKFILPTDELLLSHWNNKKGQKYAGWGLHPELDSCANGEYINWLIAAAPKHPYLLEVINLVSSQIHQESSKVQSKGGKQGVLKLTGPIPYTIAINKCISENKNVRHRLFNFWESKIKYSIFDQNLELSDDSWAIEEKKFNAKAKYNQNHYSRLKKRIVAYMPDKSDIEGGENFLKLNLGCGNKKIDGFINIDQSVICKPDLLLNLENTPYPFHTSTVQHIRMDSVLEHLPASPSEFFRILRELHRICTNRAILDIVCPHPFHRWQIVDFTHQKAISLEGLQMLDKEYCRRLIRNGDAKTPLALMYDVDFVVIGHQKFVDPECKKHITNILGTYDSRKLESYCFLFNNIIGGQHIKLQVRK